MPKYDVIAFVRELDRLGLRLSTFRHMDGTVRLWNVERRVSVDAPLTGGTGSVQSLARSTVTSPS